MHPVIEKARFPGERLLQITPNFYRQIYRSAFSVISCSVGAKEAQRPV